MSDSRLTAAADLIGPGYPYGGLSPEDETAWASSIIQSALVPPVESSVWKQVDDDDEDDGGGNSEEDGRHGDCGAHPGVMLEGRGRAREEPPDKRLELGFGGCYNYGPIGPFPVEPAFGSPEAVAQAAETIGSPVPVTRSILAAAIPRLATADLCELASAIVQQRDALADALERVTRELKLKSYAHDGIAVDAIAAAESALGKAGRS